MNMTDANAEAGRQAVSQFEALAKDLAKWEFETRVENSGEAPVLSVTNAAVRTLQETIIAAPAADGVWWFWWSWGDQIARITDVGTAAFKVAYVLMPQAGG